MVADRRLVVVAGAIVIIAAAIGVFFLVRAATEDMSGVGVSFGASGVDRVASRELPTADQIQLGPDGKYFVAARADGCRWEEHSRVTVPPPDEHVDVVLLTDCRADFRFEFDPASGRVAVLMP
jgi:hypothetical protein